MRQCTVVGLSGGVDSALAAALLRERGDDVVGVYLKIDAQSPRRDPRVCPWKEDIAMCQRVAAHLNVPLHVIDATTAYQRDVLEPFVQAYANGETPSPDIPCNRWVKFPFLIAAARELGAERVATGHYARTRSRTLATGEHIHELLRGIDRTKDQSYFLWQLTQDQLGSVEFPIGDWTKNRVRAESRRRGLPNWDRPSTRGVCFLQGIDLATYLDAHITPTRATVRTADGAVVGVIERAHALTLGQRVPVAGLHEPKYVVAKDLSHHTVTVSAHPQDAALWTSRARLREVRWLSSRPTLPRACEVQYRNLQDPISAIITSKDDGRMVVSFSAPQRAVAPGQAIVMYDGDLVLGGAVIDHP